MRMAALRALALLLSWAACSPANEVAATAPPESAAAVPAPADPSAAAADSQQWITMRYWVAGCSAPDDLWKYRKGSSTVTCDPRGRSLESAHGALVWPDYLDAGDVDVIIVEGAALESLRFELAWSMDDDFKAERSIEQDEGAANPREVRFTLRGAPEWKGLVRRFRLTWRGEPSHASRIVAAWGKRHS
jgi:hypothetical protein